LGIDIPERGGMAIMRGLALKAADRFENIQQLQQALATGAMPSQQMGHGDEIQPSKPQQAQKLIECPNCGAKNQLKPGENPEVLRCGKCQGLFGMNPIEVGSNKERNASISDEEWSKRILCSDESCIGTIGPDGHCRECGKRYAAPLNAATDTANKNIKKPEPVNDLIKNIESTVSDEEWEKRILCRDESCIGAIGPDGRCRECGKPGRQ
jgi:hypothetical protein